MMFNPFNGVYGSLIKFGVVVALVLSLYGGYKYQLHSAYKEGVKTTEIKYEAQILAQNEVLFIKKRAADKEVERDFAKREGAYYQQLKNINSQRDAALASLLNRTERPVSTISNSTSASTSESTTGATGAQLYRGDAEFLTRFANDTETLKISLVQCYADYQTVKQSIEALNQK